MDISNIKIRATNADDFLAIHKLDLEGWSNLKETDYLPDGEHTWRIWCEYAICYVAELEDEIIGFILAFPTKIKGKNCFHKIVVKESARGQKVGGKLLKRLVSEMDSRKESCFLTVAPYNEPAISLYNSLGFKQAEFVKGFYRESEDRYIMIYNGY